MVDQRNWPHDWDGPMDTNDRKAWENAGMPTQAEWTCMKWIPGIGTTDVPDATPKYRHEFAQQRVKIARLGRQINSEKRKLKAMTDGCPHPSAESLPQLTSGFRPALYRACCVLCGTVLSRHICDVSPRRFCEYDPDDILHTGCIHCAMPEER